jgi:hypothetical protein
MMIIAKKITNNRNRPSGENIRSIAGIVAYLF